MENKEKIADKKKADYQEDLEKNSADSAARSHKSYMKNPREESCWLTVQHEAAKVARKTQKKVMMTVLHEAMWATYILSQ